MTPEEKRAYMAGWRAANKQRIYEYNKQFVADNRESHDAKRAAYREANRESINQYAREYYNLNQEERKEYAAKRRELNPEQHRAAVRAWRKANPEKQKAAVNGWKAKNPDADVVHRQLRRARKKQADGKLSKGIVGRLMEFQNGMCIYCEADLKSGKHLDHKTPLSRGGANVDSNVHLTCPTCNMRKHAKTHEEFICSR